MPFVRETAMVGGKEIIVETGKWAKQAGGSVVVRCGDTMVLVTAAGSAQPRDIDFMPLTCEYRENFYSSGKIPGSFFRREGRTTNEEILICRLMDRPVRPLFPKGWKIDTQIIASVVSFDKQNPTDVLAMTGASAALHVSDLVWGGPLAGVRVGRIDGEFVANPTFAEREKSDMDIIVAASKDAIMMVEGEMEELGESVVIDALLFAHAAVQPLIELQERLRAANGKEKREFTPPVPNEAIHAQVKELAWSKLADGDDDQGQEEARPGAVRAPLLGRRGDDRPRRQGGHQGGRLRVLQAAEEVGARSHAVDAHPHRRPPHRRDPPDHDRDRRAARARTARRCSRAARRRRSSRSRSARSTTRRSSTRCSATARRRSTWTTTSRRSRPARSSRCAGQSRREVGHGFLAERSVESIVPVYEDFPYTIRIVSDILESNGSSSMASVCGGSLALMDAGVPTKSPVAGIAMGLMKEGDDYAILSDILGDEDHLGDMDFKVTGTRRGVCALQMDIKVDGLTRKILEEALDQARRGRLHILEKMDAAISAPRDEVSVYAPRIVTVQVKPDKVRDIIGPGGKTIRAIQEQTGAQIDINDNGIVSIASSDSKALEQAQALISGLTMEPEVGQYYNGIVKKIVEIGAFVEIMPGTDGLLHISEVAKERIRSVEDVLSEGDEIVVKCIKVDRDGKIRLSRREVLDANPGPEEVHNFVI